MATSGLAPLRGVVMTNDFFRWSPRTPTTGYFLATLRVALGSVNYIKPLPKGEAKHSEGLVQEQLTMTRERARTVSIIRVSGWDHLIPPAYAGGTDCANWIRAKPSSPTLLPWEKGESPIENSEL